jgi:hypothetical protein
LVLTLAVPLARGANEPATVPAPETIIAGLGSTHHQVTTKSADAQRYFDQGLALVFAFNHDEALKSFRQAALADPSCAMAYWGQALTLGPNYNLAEDPDREKTAYAAIVKARSLDASATDEERALIEALAKRYTPDGAMNPAQQKTYADAMREVHRNFPDDPDAGALFAESMMDLHPWALWTADGKPAEGTLEIVATLEDVLKRHPDHIGANHYYIHAVEASLDPSRALPSAARLGKLAPGAGHLVHMPSHIYIRTGKYQDSAAANARAVAVDKAYIAQHKPTGVYVMMYYPHNIQFLWASYLMTGQSRAARKAARELDSAVSYEGVRAMPMAEFVKPTRYFTEVRFSKWNEILEEPAPPAYAKYTNAMWHYARGIAYAATGKPEDAATESAALDKSAAAIPESLVFNNNTARVLAALASKILSGEQKIASGKSEAGLKDLSAAVAAQDALGYDEPPAWFYPVRETYAVELIRAGHGADAEVVLNEDLRRNPENGWALAMLAQVLRARGDQAGAASLDARFKTAWRSADVAVPEASAEKTAARY